jgi:conjugal transfer pilus assembly protein TraV
VKYIFVPLLALSLGACSFAGYKSTTSFRCAEGLKNENSTYCASISQNYQDSVSGLKVGDSKERKQSGYYRSSNTPMSQSAAASMMQTGALNSGMPIRSQVEIARVWIAPYLDSEGDLVDQNYTYMTLNEGRWLIEHNYQNIVEEYRPVRLLGGGSEQQPSVQNLGQSNNGLIPDQVPDVGLKLQ